MRYLADYRSLVGLVFDLINSTAHRPIPQGEECKNNGQMLAINVPPSGDCTFATGTHPWYRTGSLCRPQLDWHNHSSMPGNLSDVPHVFTPASTEVGDYRYSAGWLGGLQDRQALHALSNRFEIKQQEERLIIEKLQRLLNASAEFLSLTPKQQKKVLAGDWKIAKSWTDLGEEAGFPRKLFEDLYTHICNHAHSSYLSVIQIRDARNEGKDRDMASLGISVGVMTMACFVESYTRVFPASKAVLETKREAADIAARWYKAVTTMDIAYTAAAD